MQNENQRDLNFERELKNSRLFLWANLLEAGTHNFTRLSQKGKFEFASKILTRTHGTCQKTDFVKNKYISEASKNTKVKNILVLECKWEEPIKMYPTRLHLRAVLIFFQRLKCSSNESIIPIYECLFSHCIILFIESKSNYNFLLHFL